MLTEPVNGCLVQELEDSSAGSPRNHVVHEVRINKGCGAYHSTLWRGCLAVNLFGRCTIDCLHPVLLDRFWECSFSIRNASTEANSSPMMLLHVLHKATKALKMTLTWIPSKAAQRHDCMCNLETRYRYCPLDCSNQRLKLHD
eukprot:scaffold15939_cov123-Amphora_coffeaeformis.AAC.2